MRCSEAKRILRPSDALRVDDKELGRAIEHAEDCPQCASLLDHDRRVSRLIRDCVPRVQAPPKLRERLTAALARERAREVDLHRAEGPAAVRPRPVRWRRAAGWGALVAASITLLIFPLGSWIGSDTSARDFTRDYLRRAIVQETLATDDPGQMTAFFARELGQRVRPPLAAGYDLDRAMVCLMNQRRAAVIEYRIGNDRISYFIIPRTQSQRAGRYEALDIQEMEDLRLPTYGGDGERLTVAAWRDSDHDHALVGNVNPDRLRDLLPVFGCPPAEA